jgi:tRNA pseudouridine38-40 synthase
MQNIKITIQYDGTDYHGWQIQARGRTIQGELTRVLSLLDDRQVTVHGSGRTDAGVHAEGQVASFFLQRSWDVVRLRDAINGNLDPDIRVVGVEFVDDSFHARASAKRKVYRYRICTAPVISPFLYRFVYHHRGPLERHTMFEASRPLVGEHDFSAFTVAGSEAESRVRAIHWISFDYEHEDEDDDGFSIIVAADGFLRYMVRIIVGTLIEVGRGRRGPDSVSRVLASRDRRLAGPTASAAGLTLVRVDY